MAKIKIKSVTKGSAPSASTVQNSTLEPDIENGDQLNTIDVLPTNDPSQVPEYDVDQQFVMPPPDDHGTVLPPPVELNPQCPVPPPPKPLPPPPGEPKQCPFPPPPPPFLPPSPCCSGGTTQIVDNVLVQTDDPEKITVEEGTYKGMKVFKIGATTFQGIGTTGMVPKPGPDDADKFLDSNGNWTKIVIRQSDWNQDDPTEIDYIKNRPDIDAMIAEETSRAEAAEAAATTEVVQGENVTVDLQIAQDGHRVYTVTADTENKADKVANAHSGHFAGLDSNGNLTDSGFSSQDFATAEQGHAADSAIQGVNANGTPLVPDENNVIDIPAVTEQSDGLMTAEDKAKLDSISDDATHVESSQINGHITIDGVDTTVYTHPTSATEDGTPVYNRGLYKFAVNDCGHVIIGSNHDHPVPVTDTDIAGLGIFDPTYAYGQANKGATVAHVTNAIDAAVEGLDAEITSNDGNNVQVKVTQQDGVVTDVNIVVDNTLNADDIASKADKVIDAVPGHLASLDATGNLVDSGAAVNSDPNSASFGTDVPTGAAVKSIVSGKLDHLDVQNKLVGGKYITELSQTDGLISYEVGTMDEHPSSGSKKPVTSEGIYNSIDAEKTARVHFDTWIAERVPSAASGQNQLADKAYVDDLGERLEARYLAYSASNLPFPTYEIFDQTKASGEFWYDGQIVAPNNNDVIVITADESKTDMSTTGNPPTTRYRYIAHKVQAMDGDNPVVDTDGNPVWLFDDHGNIIWSGDWFFEYIINNSALNQAQLLAINSGITATKVGNYDSHLTDYNNPHQVNFEQVATQSGITATATEVNILSGATVDTSELNTLDGIRTDKTVQNQIDGKADRVLPVHQSDPEYHPQGSIVIVSDQADVNGRYNIEDSGAKITQYYNPSDTTNPATGSAIKQAMDGLDAEIRSNTGTNVNVTVAQTDGKVSGVVIDDHTASAEQGALADSAIQKVKVASIDAGGVEIIQELSKDTSDGNAVIVDLTDYKHIQTAVADPQSSGDSLDFISNISQNTGGVITVTKKSVSVDHNYDSQSTNPASGAAIADALGGLGGESTGEGALVNVTVNTVGGEVNSVTVDDSKVVERANDVLESAIDAIDNKIQSLDVSNILQDGKYITSLSEMDGKIQVETASMDTVPTTGSQKPVTSGGVKTAIDNKIAGLHGSATGEGDLVNVTVTTEGGEVTSVSVDDEDIRTATGEAIQQAIDGLDVGNTLSPGTYITSLSEADGKIQVSTENMDTTPTANSVKPVTSGGVSAAIGSAVESLDYTDTPVAHQFVTEVDETDGIISVTRAQPTLADVDGLESTLDTKADKVDGAIEGNLATFDATGNIADTGLNANTFATAEQGDKADTAVQSVKMVDGNGVELNNDTSVIIPLAAPTGSGETPGLMSAADKAKLDGLDGNLNEKADKVTNATAGNLASLDETGNLADSGIGLESVITGVYLELDDDGSKTSESLVSGHVATIRETTDEEIRRILAVLP